MSAWILPACVNDKKDYYYEVDRSLETLKTIFWAQSRPITNIEVGDIVYIYEGVPIQAIGWKCKVLAVKVLPQNVDIDESEFEHGETEREGYYIKVVALAKYEGKEREALSLDKLRENGLTQVRSPFNLNSPRVNPQLLDYINSVKPSVIYDD